MHVNYRKDMVVYQIYPRSFCDTNGDGIGDLPGVIEKLDYLKELGVDIVWLSPIYCSPLADQGYDISDYYNIDPRFGTMEDMDRLLAEAKKRDMHILMDLVVNHCSDEHEWFRKACEDPDGKYGKYFYICDWKEGEPLPTNWRSYFGGSCWDLLPGHTDKVYLHMFHKKQPDLNWENPEVKEDIYKMINWWLEKGLSGFRIDAIINIKKVLPFKDYPVDRADGMSSLFAMLEENDQSAAIPIPKLPELKKAEMMTMEKETTGIYLTGHPMDDYRKYLRNTHVLPIGTLMSEECTIKDEQIVSVAGIVQSVKMKTTRNNSMMSYVTVEDDTAAIEMLAFSNVLSQYGGYLRENSAVVITGRLSLRDDKDPQIVINRARPITDFSEMPEIPVKTEEPVAVKPLSGTLYLQLQSEDDPKYRKVKAIVNMFPGDSQVKVFFADTRKLRGALAMLDPVMIQELKNLLGEGNVVLK